MNDSTTQYRDVSYVAPNGGTLFSLINGELGWLMYLREEGDAGFSTRNPDYSGPKGATVSFKLNNGQIDEYPQAWCYPLEIVERALEYFLETGQPPTFVRWHNDSGDGKPITPSAPRHGERSARIS